MSGCEPLQIRRCGCEPPQICRSDSLSFATPPLSADVEDIFKRKVHFLLVKNIRIALPEYAGRASLFN